jgi:hypothetical protein
MPTDGNSQLESLWDACAAAVLNTYDAYGWLLPALLLTLLFFLVFAIVCWAMDDIGLDLPILEGPAAIFRCCRKRWEPRGEFLKLSISPSPSSPSEPPPSSVRE